jgi:hypothetical protein
VAPVGKKAWTGRRLVQASHLLLVEDIGNRQKEIGVAQGAYQGGTIIDEHDGYLEAGHCF